MLAQWQQHACLLGQPALAGYMPASTASSFPYPQIPHSKLLSPVPQVRGESGVLQQRLANSLLVHSEVASAARAALDALGAPTDDVVLPADQHSTGSSGGGAAESAGTAGAAACGAGSTEGAGGPTNVLVSKGSMGSRGAAPARQQMERVRKLVGDALAAAQAEKRLGVGSAASSEGGAGAPMLGSEKSFGERSSAGRSRAGTAEELELSALSVK